MILEPAISFNVYSIFIAVTLLMLLGFEAGYRIGNLGSRNNKLDFDSMLSPIVTGLLRMLAFVLAFAFAMAVSNQNDRNKYVLDEANAINTAYLQTNFIAPQKGDEIKVLLKEYVDIRLLVVKAEKRQFALDRSLEIHQLLWARVDSLVKSNPTSPSFLLAESINTIINMHEKRMSAGLYVRIQSSIWMALFMISILTMLTVGIQASTIGHRCFIIFIPLCLAYSVLVTLVIDLDRPQSGLITVGQQSMETLQHKLNQY